MPFLELGNRILPLDAENHRIGHLDISLPVKPLAVALACGSLALYDDLPSGLLLHSFAVGLYVVSDAFSQHYRPSEILSTAKARALVLSASWHDKRHMSFGGETAGRLWRYRVRPFARRCPFAFMDAWDFTDHCYRPALVVFDL